MDGPQDVQNGPAAGAEQQQAQKPPVKRYRRADLDEEDEKNALPAEDGDE